VTESGFLESTREGYDLTASVYAERFHDHLHDKPLDRAMLSGFAGLVGRAGVVADVGCGTGATSRMLTDFGLDVVGIDLSANMLAEARRRNPGLRFQVGSMTAMDFDDGHFDGVCAWYSVIHIPDEELPHVLAEFHRVLRPGGWALIHATRLPDRPSNVSLCAPFQRNVAHSFTFDVRRPSRRASATASPPAWRGASRAPWRWRSSDPDAGRWPDRYTRTRAPAL
jgi:ubiquinone/menaquinone biosynthesis C-methylase UbiE